MDRGRWLIPPNIRSRIDFPMAVSNFRGTIRKCVPVFHLGHLGLSGLRLQHLQPGIGPFPLGRLENSQGMKS